MEERQAERDDETTSDGSVASMVEMLTDAIVAAARRLGPETRMAVLYRVKPKTEQ